MLICKFVFEQGAVPINPFNLFGYDISGLPHAIREVPPKELPFDPEVKKYRNLLLQ
jgi:hypothetical protein